MKPFKFAAGVIAGALLASAASAGVTVSHEAAGVQAATASLANAQIATFDNLSGWAGEGSNIFAGAPISGTVTSGGFLVGDANVYGGAGAAGKFGTVFNTTTIQLSSAVNYAGLWASAIDGDFSSSLGNTVALYSNGVLLGSYALKPELADADSGYWGNPNAAYAGQDLWEPFAFFDFNSTTAFDRIDIVQNGGGGFELDNITIGNTAPLVHIGAGNGDNALAAVPEPASWVMMLVGFGVLGLMLRSRKNAVVFG